MPDNENPHAMEATAVHESGQQPTLDRIPLEGISAWLDEHGLEVVGGDSDLGGRRWRPRVFVRDRVGLPEESTAAQLQDGMATNLAEGQEQMGIALQTQTHLLPTGHYVARIVDIRVATIGHGHYLQFGFALLDSDLPIRSLIARCSTQFRSGSTLYAWTRAALGGRKIPPAWKFDRDALLSRVVVLSVLCCSDADGAQFNHVAQVLPYHGRQFVQPPLLVRQPPQCAPRAADPAWSRPDWLTGDEPGLQDLHVSFGGDEGDLCDPSTTA